MLNLYREQSNNSPVGEPKTEFAKGSGRGPFECGNCVHMKDGGCVHPEMVKYSRQPKMGKDAVKVDDKDCCKFIRRPGD